MIARRTRRTDGFTILELSISIAILGVVMGAVTVFQQRSQSASADMQVRSHAESEARETLDEVTREILGVGSNQITPDPTSNAGTDVLNYQKPVSVSALGVLTWSATSRIGLEMDDGEVDNGIDDDGDRFTDERRLVLVRDVGLATQKTVTLVHGIPELVPGETANVLDDNGNGIVDERGFNIQRTGDLLTLRLCLQRLTQEQRVVTVSLQTALVLHN